MSTYLPFEDGILLIDKPSGMTSFDVIRVLRKKLGIRKMGHAGTLDPLATGLMIIGIESGTKKLHEYLKLPKVYEAEILLGERTATGDMEGKVLEEKAVPEISRTVLEQSLQKLQGRLVLPVSPYSAIKQGGIPLYKRARKAEKQGIEITELPVREMEVFKVELLSVERGVDTHVKQQRPTVGEAHRLVVGARFCVGSGTYVRSLAEAFGKDLGYPATLRNLRRTSIGVFDISEARTLESF